MHYLSKQGVCYEFPEMFPQYYIHSSIFSKFNSFRGIDALRQLLRFAMDALSRNPYFRIFDLLFINRLTTN